MKNQKAAFFDRDGVLIEDTHLITTWDQVHLKPGVASVLQQLRERDFLLVMVTNQAVVARGLLSLANTEALNQKIVDALGGFDGVYICPHHPNANVAEYRTVCQCRKPHPGMLLQAQSDLGIDLEKSFMVGDRPTDIACANQAGVHSIFMQGPTQSQARTEYHGDIPEKYFVPDFQFKEWDEFMPKFASEGLL